MPDLLRYEFADDLFERLGFLVIVSACLFQAWCISYDRFTYVVHDRACQDLETVETVRVAEMLLHAEHHQGDDALLEGMFGDRLALRVVERFPALVVTESCKHLAKNFFDMLGHEYSCAVGGQSYIYYVEIVPLSIL